MAEIFRAVQATMDNIGKIHNPCNIIFSQVECQPGKLKLHTIQIWFVFGRLGIDQWRWITRKHSQVH
jgi:hypothetical protein